MIIASRGPVSLTEDAGFASPIVFDADRGLARTLDVEATPSAVVVDGQGKIASAVIRGEPHIRSLLERIGPPESAAAPHDRAQGEAAHATQHHHGTQKLSGQILRTA